jgi:hypothetical protein
MNLLKRYFRVFGGTLSPALVTYGICLGFFFGLMPQGASEFGTYVLVGLLLFTRQSYGFMATSGAITKAILVFGPWQMVAKTGRSVLETKWLASFWKYVLDIPGIYLLQLERYTAMGGFIWAMLLTIVLFYPICKTIGWIRDGLLPKLRTMPLIGGFANGWTGWLIKLIFFGVRPLQAEEMVATELAVKLAQPETEKEEVPLKKRGLIYWRLLIPFIILMTAFEFFLGDRIIGFITEKVGNEQFNMNILMKDSHLSLFSGRIKYDGFAVKRNNQDFCKLEKANVNLSMEQVLKGSVVVEEVRLTNPEFRWVRNDGLDGNLTDKLREELRKKLNDQDFVDKCIDDIKEQLKKLEEYGKEKAGDQQVDPALANLSKEDQELMGRASYLRRRPLFWLQKLICDGLTISFEDKVSGANDLQLRSAHIEMDNVTSDPGLVDDPFAMELIAKLGHSKNGEAPNSKITVIVEHKIKTKETRIAVTLEEIPVEWVDPYIAKSVPLIFFGTTTASLRVEFLLRADGIEARPSIALQSIQCRVRDPQSNQKILGLEAKRLARELNVVRDIELTEIRIYGTMDNPRIDFGNTLETLVIQGGKKYALNKGRAEANKGINKADRKVDKKLGKFDKKIGKKLGKYGINSPKTRDVLNKITGGDGTKGTANNVLDGIQKGVGGLLDGLGGTKKKDPAKTEKEKKSFFGDLFGND